jgi:hypothetical protein
VQGGDNLSMVNAEREPAAKALRLEGGKCIFEGVEIGFAIGPAVCRGGVSHFRRFAHCAPPDSLQLQQIADQEMVRARL